MFGLSVWSARAPGITEHASMDSKRRESRMQTQIFGGRCLFSVNRAELSLLCFESVVDPLSWVIVVWYLIVLWERAARTVKRTIGRLGSLRLGPLYRYSLFGLHLASIWFEVSGRSCAIVLIWSGPSYSSGLRSSWRTTAGTNGAFVARAQTSSPRANLQRNSSLGVTLLSQ